MTVELYDQDESVIGLWMKGQNATQISRALALPRKDVQQLIKRYKEATRNDQEGQDIARDTLNKMVDHYDRLIGKAYELLEELEELSTTPATAGKRADVLNHIATWESKRVDAMQKAGYLDNADLGDQLAQMERDKEIVLDILRNHLCDRCRPNVMRKIGEISGRVEVVVVQDN